MSSTQLQSAQIIWQDNVPYSTLFNDIYYSHEDGIAESNYVFLKANDLPKRWQDEVQLNFRILELGFGTGLNCLLAAQVFKNYASEKSKLIIKSCELYPLKIRELETALESFLNPPQLTNPGISLDMGQALLQQYKSAQPGWQYIILQENRVELHLYLGEALDMLAELRSQYFHFDACFLDGFAPACNPEMWRLEILESLATLAWTDASLATFTAAGYVRRGLQAAGFAMEKIPGFGRKAEMLRGRRMP